MVPQLEQDLLASIPAWEAEAGRSFLVHGESMMQILLEAVNTSNDKENRRKLPGQRAGSVPPRAVTPSNNHGGSKGVVTPAVRSSSIMLGSQSVPSNKRPRLGDSTTTYSNGGGPRTN